jgi:hypothetical protein
LFRGNVILTFVPNVALCLVYPPRPCYAEFVSGRKSASKRVTAMPVAVKIKAGNYGTAIGLLLRRGGSFQTRHERTLIVNSEQRKVLEEADVVETTGLGSGKEHGHKKDAS